MFHYILLKVTNTLLEEEQVLNDIFNHVNTSDKYNESFY